MTDAELVSRVLSGEETLFKEIIERYAGYVWALCSSYVRNQSDCEDVVQESFIQCYRRLDTLRNRNAFPCWLRQLARNRSLIWLRTASRRRAALAAYAEESQVGETAEQETPDTSAEREELHRGIRAQIGGLPENFREALSLHYIGGYSIAEAARFLGIRPDAMKKRLEIGRKKLKAALVEEIEVALAPGKPPERLDAMILAAIPFGEAPWLAKAAVAGAVAGKAGLMGRLAAAKAVFAVVCGLAVFGFAFLVTYGVVKRTGMAQSNVGANRAMPALQAQSEEPSQEVEEPFARAPKATPSARPEGPLDERHIPSILQKAKETVATDDAERESKNRVEKALDAMVTCEFDGEDISHILDFVGGYCSICFAMDYRVVSPPPAVAVAVPESDGAPFESEFAEYVTDGVVEELDVRDVTLLEALEHVLYPLGLDFVLEPGFIWISTPDRIQQEVVQEPDERYEPYMPIEESLETTVSLVFHDTHLADIAAFTSNYAKTNVVLDYRVIRPDEISLAKLGEGQGAVSERPRPEAEYVSDGVVYRIGLKEIMVRDLLKALLRPLNLAYRVEPGYVWISSPEKIRQETGMVFGYVPEGEDASFMANPVSIVSETSHIAEILAFLAEQEDIDIVLDAAVVTPPLKGESDVVAAASSGRYATAGIVPAIDVKRLPLRDVMTMLLRPLNLAYAIQGGTVWVSTRPRLEADNYEDWERMVPLAPEVAPAGPDPSKTSGVSGDTGVTLVCVHTMPDGTCWAELRIGHRASRSYVEGERFECFRLDKIDAEAGTVTVYSECDGQSHILTQQREQHGVM